MQEYLITFLSFAFVTIIIGKLYMLTWERIYGQELTPQDLGFADINNSFNLKS